MDPMDPINMLISLISLESRPGLYCIQIATVEAYANRVRMMVRLFLKGPCECYL